MNQIGKKSGGNQISSSIAFDGVGNIFAAGNFYDTAFFNIIGGTIDTLIPSTNDVYLAKYNPDGTCFWAKSVKGDNSTNQIYGIDLSNDGNIFMTGVYKFGYLPTTRIIDFDNGNPDDQITSYPTANVYEEDAYLVKYLCSDTTSSFHWSEIVCGDSLVIGGISYTASGIYTQIHPNKAGCDSLVTIELVVFP